MKPLRMTPRSRSGLAVGTAMLGAAAFGVGAALYALFVERTLVQLDRYTVPSAGSGLPPGGITILHLSDFHFRAGGRVQARKIARARRLMAGLEYDLVALTGDLIHDAAGFPHALELIGSLTPRLGAFACPGNHDYSEYSVWGVFDHTWREGEAAGRPARADLIGALRKLADFARKVLRNELVRLPVAFNDVPAMNADLRACGFTPLVNRAVHVQAAGADFWVAGVDDLTEGRPDLAVALSGVPEGAPVLLLAHNPDGWLDPLAERAGLILAGHTHGGQVRLPGVGAAHTQGTHLSRRRPAGWFQRGGTRMFVSRGLGESIPLRFGAPPQIALIHWAPEITIPGGVGSTASAGATTASHG
jgi:predicted MPP superfamily phosphohydrolase